MRPNTTKLVQLAALGLLALPYLAYTAFVMRVGHGPVDYETFMRIGRALLTGGQVYGENSYYPLPYVMIFTAFTLLPAALSLAVWLLAPVIAALIIGRGHPFVLLFAPLFAHFAGGQSTLVSMLGLWGYRVNPRLDQMRGGAWLGVMLLKPQLALVPLAFAAREWWLYWRLHGRVPRQAWGCVVTAALLYAPAFALWPSWPLAWLSSPRPLFARALSGLIPRALVYLTESPAVYWGMWLLLTAVLVMVFRRYYRGPLGLTPIMLLSFIVNPFVHDYDLIQLIPLLQTRGQRWAAVLLSVPVWVVIVAAYGVDAAWSVVTLIAPGLLGVWLHEQHTHPRKTLTGIAYQGA